MITGRITDESGKPIVAMSVQAIRVRDELGRKINSNENNNTRPRNTDDRGIYRLYGLLPGKYIVQTGTGNPFGFVMGGMNNALGENAPVYHPGVARQAASEVSVAAGDEITGIDIRFQVEAGHSIRIKVVGAESVQDSSNSIVTMSQNTVTLEHYPGGSSAGADYSNIADTPSEMVLHAIADGEYIVSAMRGNFWVDNDQVGYISERRRLTVKGADLRATLTLTPLGSIAGKFESDTIPEKDRPKTCPVAVPPSLTEMLVRLRRTGIPADEPSSMWANQITAPNEKGEFKQRRLQAGNYRMSANLADENRYIKSISFPAAAPGKSTVAPLDPNKSGLQLKAGENLKDVIVKLAEGAASVSGRVATSANQTPPKLRIHLIPAEKDAGDDVLRYAETGTNSGGTFRFSHLAPGLYWVLAKPIDPQISEELQSSPVAWDSTLRIKLRREAEVSNQKIDLTLCQRLSDIIVK